MSKKVYHEHALDTTFIVGVEDFEELCEKVRQQDDRMSRLENFDYGARIETDKVVLTNGDTEKRTIYLNEKFWTCETALAYNHLIIWPSRFS